MLNRILLSISLTTIIALIINVDKWYEGLIVAGSISLLITFTPYLIVKGVQIYCKWKYKLEPEMFWLLVKVYADTAKAARLAKKEGKES